MSGTNEKARAYVNLALGDPAPWVTQWAGGEEPLALHKSAGRYIVLCFFASAGDKTAAAALEDVHAHRPLFDGTKASFIGVSVDRGDQNEGRIRAGLEYFRDFDGAVSRAYGSLPQDFQPRRDANVPVRRFWIVLDPMLRVLRVLPFTPEGSERAALFQFLQSLPPPERHTGMELQAPVLLLPNVFEPEFCRRLIDLYEAAGGVESGFMREVGGKTTMVMDPAHKRRRDYTVADSALIEAAKSRIARRVVPEIAKAHQFHVTRMERFIVACYDAAEDGHFNPHRDNTTKGTAHRRFAVSLNLNDDYEGGEVRFPEFGPRGIKPPAGAAVVFSCSLLHAANLVTRGKRYVFLPFLYDEAAAAIREKNNKYLDESLGQYRAG